MSKPFSPEDIKARRATVERCLAHKMTLQQTAVRLGIDRGSLSNWIGQYAPELSGAFGGGKRATPEWTPAADAIIRKGHNDALSAGAIMAQINTAFGWDVSRSQIRTRASHLGLGAFTRVPINRTGLWTKPMDTLLRDRLAKGETYAVIAAAVNDTFGATVSRGSVSGRVHRLGLKRVSPGTSRRFSNNPRAVPVTKALAPVRRAIPEDKRIPVHPNPKTLMELSDHDCKWPLSLDTGDDCTPAAETYCGAMATHGSYCAGHHQRGTVRQRTEAEQARDAEHSKRMERLWAQRRGKAAA